MAKRFTDSERFNTPFYRSLKAPYKLLWEFVNAACDHAGIWTVDFEFAEMRTGEQGSINQQDAEQIFRDKIIVLQSGLYWFIPEFIDLQYKGMILSPENRAHPVRILQKYSLINSDFVVYKHEELINGIPKNKGLTKPLTTPLQGCKDKDKEKDKVKDKGKGAEKNKKAKPEPAEPSDTDLLKSAFIITPFVTAFNAYKMMRKKKRWDLTGDDAIALIHTKLNNLSGGDDNLKVAILNQSTSLTYRGLFKLNDDNLKDFIKQYKYNPYADSEKPATKANSLADNAVFTPIEGLV